ncbi:hypothetical protein Bca4012_044927 [Brassica carinata]|uniref:Uncharacterized protein n=1 Tax=Brassica carinata TaxID=52824 RepID=A0A8X7QWE3_BRACI|nr:hypothetical protein Bca52824_057613 [Brassica carinata]
MIPEEARPCWRAWRRHDHDQLMLLLVMEELSSYPIARAKQVMTVPSTGRRSKPSRNPPSKPLPLLGTSFLVGSVSPFPSRFCSCEDCAG